MTSFQDAVILRVSIDRYDPSLTPKVRLHPCGWVVETRDGEVFISHEEWQEFLFGAPIQKGN